MTRRATRRQGAPTPNVLETERLILRRLAVDDARIVAITSPDNASSGRLLEKLGMKTEKTVKLAVDDEEFRLYASDF